MYKKNLKFWVMSKDMAKSLVAAALMVAFSTPVAANTATGSRSASGAFSKQADGIVMPTAADGSNGSNNALGGAIGIEYLDGKTVAEIKAAAVTSDTNLSDADPDKVFFLYNVKTGKFLNAGGYWGTHVSLKDYPLSLWAKTNDYRLPSSSTTQTLIDFIQNLETGVGKYLGWMSGKDTDEGVFIDRKQDEGTHYGWVFVPLNDGKKTYKIYTYATYKPYSSSSTKYYLCANKGDIDQDKNCGAFSESYIKTEKLTGYDTWRVLTMAQISDLLTKKSDNMTSALDLSYRLDCPGFSRGNKDITVWKVNNFSTGTKGEWRFGLEKLYNTHNTLTGSGESSLDKYDKNNLSSSTPYTFDGKTYTELENYQRHLGKYFCADVKNMRGVIYQDVVIKAPGSYLIECKGFSTTPKAKIFASWFDKKGGKNEDKSLMHQNVLNQVSYMSKAEQDALHVSEQNMDYAGKNFYGQRKYINTVLIQVPETKKQSENNYGVIRFGLIIGDNKSDDTVNEADKEWTVFDDFRLLYASDDKGVDLILDEDRKDLSYLTECSNTYKNRVLHLNKTFTKDKWNSFVLPVSLKRDQFRQAFGANARLAKLSGLTSSEIQFKTIDMDATKNDTVLTAYTPYIIFPTKIHTDTTKVSPAYKATLLTTDGESKTQEVVIKANHYDIPNVTFKTNSKNENDLSEMNTDTWVLNVTPQVDGTDGSMEAYGTFARTFGQDAPQITDEKDKDYGVYKFNDHKIIDGRDDLIGCYFFDRGNLYYSSKDRVRGLRGFSCWFKPVNSASTKLNLYIDGVANGTTGIDEVAFGDEEPTGKAAKGIYNMNGQLVSNGSDTTNLPAGMYIVNGKKCVVR